MKNLTPLEEQEQKWLVEWLRAMHIPFYAIPNSQDMSALNRQHAINLVRKLKALGLSPGVPDLCLFLPKFACYVEVKRVKGGVVSDDQAAWIEVINGFPYARAFVCRGFSAAADLVESLLLE